MKVRALVRVRGWKIGLTSKLDADSDVDPSEEDEDYEEFIKKAKRHKQYKTKRKEKADAAQVEADAKVTDQPSSLKFKREKKLIMLNSAPLPCLPCSMQLRLVHFGVHSYSRPQDIFVSHKLTASLTQIVEGVSNSAVLKATVPPQYSFSTFIDLALHYLANPPKYVFSTISN